MVGRGEDETEPVGLEAAPQVRGRELDLDPQFFEDIRAAAFAGDCPVAVFHHAGAARGEDEHRGRRDIEEFQFVAAGAADIDDGARELFQVQSWIDGPREQRLHESSDLACRLALRPQRLEKIRLGGVAGFQGCQRGDRLVDLRGIEFAPGLQFPDQVIHRRDHWWWEAMAATMTTATITASTASVIFTQLNGYLPAIAPCTH